MVVTRVSFAGHNYRGRGGSLLGLVHPSVWETLDLPLAVTVTCDVRFMVTQQVVEPIGDVIVVAVVVVSTTSSPRPQ